MDTHLLLYGLPGCYYQREQSSVYSHMANKTKKSLFYGEGNSFCHDANLYCSLVRCDTSSEVEEDVHDKYGVVDTVEEHPGTCQGVVFFEESNAHWQDDQVDD